MLVFMLIVTATFFSSLFINKLLVKKLAKDEFLFMALTVLLAVAKESKDERYNIDNAMNGLSKWQLTKFGLSLILFIVLYTIYTLLSIVMNLSLLLINAIGLFLLLRFAVSLFTDNEGIITYLSLTGSMLFSLYAVKLYALWYKLLGVKNSYEVTHKSEDENELAKSIHEYFEGMAERYDFKTVYIKLINFKELKALVFFVAILLIIATSMERVGDISILDYEWWRLITESGFQTVLTFVAVDRFVNYIKSEIDKAKKIKNEEIAAKSVIKEENENGNQ